MKFRPILWKVQFSAAPGSATCLRSAAVRNLLLRSAMHAVMTTPAAPPSRCARARARLVAQGHEIQQFQIAPPPSFQQRHPPPFATLATRNAHVRAASWALPKIPHACRARSPPDTLKETLWPLGPQIPMAQRRRA